MATTMTSLNTKVSAEEKDEFTRTAAALGLTPSSAIKVFVRMFNAYGGFPFEVRQPVNSNSVTYLSDRDYDALVKQLGQPLPSAARSLLEREYEWAD